MIINTIRVNLFLLAVGLICVWGFNPAYGAQLYAPEILWKRNIASKTTPKDIADTHLGIPYRDDGALDSNGNFVTFNRPESVERTPGLNCSGLVLSIARFVFNRNLTLNEASRDRQGNSGPDSPLGQDWDFGLDLVLNITDGAPRRVLSPDGREHQLDGADGKTLRGFDLHDSAAWPRILGQMSPGRVYLGTISKPSRRPGYELLHYHVVIVIPDEKGDAWLYHSTHRSNAHRINLKTDDGMRKFMSQFRDNRGEGKRILLVEAIVPGSTVADSGRSRDEKNRTNQPPNDDEDLASGALKALEDAGRREGPAPPSDQAEDSAEDAPEPGPPAAGSAPAAIQTPTPQGPNLVITHLSGKVFKPFAELSTDVPRFSDEHKTGLKFGFRNSGGTPRNLEVVLRTPDGEQVYKGQIGARGQDLTVVYPRDFGAAAQQGLRPGRYAVTAKVDQANWLTDVVEVSAPRDALPKIVSVTIPSSVRSGSTFTFKITAENQGAESDYGGVTVSSPNPDGLHLVSVKPGRIFGKGSTVLAVTQDKIKTKVPMAERWIELWGENKRYDMEVTAKAGRPGTYHLYVRCALRAVEVKSNAVLMDPSVSDVVDQQGFPAKVYTVTVQ